MPDRSGTSTGASDQLQGLLLAAGNTGFNAIDDTGLVVEAGCWAHARRKFYDLHVARPTPLITWALRRIGELYGIRSKPYDGRRVARQLHAKPLFDDLERWLHTTLAMLSRKADTAAAILYAPKAVAGADTLLPAMAVIGLDNSAVERSLREIASRQRNYTFVSVDSGSERAASVYGPIGTTKWNRIAPNLVASYADV